MLAPIGWLEYLKRGKHCTYYWLHSLPDHLICAQQWKTAEIKAHKAAITYLTFSEDGTLVASGDDSGSVGIWCADSGQGKLLQGHTNRILRAEFSSVENRQILSTICFNGVVRMWGATCGECISAESGLEDLRRIAVSGDLAPLGRTSEGVWCGYWGAVQELGVFGLWVQAVGNVLRIFQTPEEAGSRRYQRETWYQVIKPENWVNPLCDWDFECKRCHSCEGFQREPPIACSDCGYDGRVQTKEGNT